MRGYWLNSFGLWKFNNHYQATKRKEKSKVYYGYLYTIGDKKRVYYGTSYSEGDKKKVYYGLGYTTDNSAVKKVYYGSGYSEA